MNQYSQSSSSWSDILSCHILLRILGVSDSDALLDLLKPQNADKILIKIADLGNACWVVSDYLTRKLKQIIFEITIK